MAPSARGDSHRPLASPPRRRKMSVFFSSRRRHTRYWRDWSSDVCSSDLGMVVLFSTAIGIMDYVSRLSASELKISFFRDSQVVTESRIYFVFAWIIALAGSLILLLGLEAPLVLLIIAAAGGGVVMFFYSGMLIWLNTRSLPDPIKDRKSTR